MKRIFILAPLWALSISLSVRSTIINVPADYPTIQQGIDASSDGDTVLVQPGTYVENINFSGHNIVLGSLFLTTGDTSYIEQTVIDGDSAGSVITFGNGEDSTAMLTGFIIQNGLENRGGGIKCQNSSPYIRNNIIKNNASPRNSEGGGIYLMNSDPVITYNKIFDNYGGFGGGIYCENSDPTINYNLICFNEIYQYRYGGGIYLTSSNPTIIGNTISMNIGVAICCYNSSVEVRNTILWHNIQGEIASYQGGAALYYCDIRGGWGGSGNINADPLFADPSNYDFNVCSQSPCIDAGDPNILDPDSTTSDIGFYFADHPECSFGNIWYVSVSGNDTTGNGSIDNPFRTIRHAVEVSRSLDTVLVSNGIYLENVAIVGKSILLASNYIFSMDTLDIAYTIIDGDSAGSVITMFACDSLASLKGLTIRNGLAAQGGGLYSYSTDPEISNCVFQNNVASGAGGGVRAYRSNVQIYNCIFTGNSAVGGGGFDGGISGEGGKIIGCIFESNQALAAGGAMIAELDTVRGCRISNNSASEGGGFWNWSSNTEIVNNVFLGNDAGMGGAIFLYESTNRIIGNIFQNNIADSTDEWISGGGGICTIESKPDIINNLFFGNVSYTNGGGLMIWGYYPWGGAPNVVNNTFSLNSAEVGGAVYNEECNQIFDNNICWNDSAAISPEFHLESGYPNIWWCDIQGGQMNLDPLFRDPDDGDFRLMSIACGDSADSPCIDTGDPFMNDIFLDCDWGLGTNHSDIGAYGGGDSVMSDIHNRPEMPTDFLLSQNYPNPFNSATTITFGLPYESHTNLTIYDILGRQVEILIEQVLPAGHHRVQWDASSNPSGIYFYVIKACNLIEKKKIVLLK